MSTVTPPSQPQAPPAPQVALVRAAVTQASQALAELPAGTKIDVVIADIVAAGEIKVASSLGDISLKLPAQVPVKTGDALIMQLINSGATPRVQLAAADGRPLTLGPLLSQTKADGTPTLQSPPLSNRIQLAPGGIVTATLLRPITLNAGQIVAPLAATAAAPAGVLLQPQPKAQGNPVLPGVTAQGTTPATAQPGSPAAGQPGLPAQPTAPGTGSGTGQPNPATAPAATPNVNVPSGSVLSVKIIAVNMATSPPTSLVPPPAQGAPSLAPGTVISGIVSGQHGVGQTVVETYAGPISLPTTSPLAPGSTIKFEIHSLNPPSPNSAQHGQMHAEGAPLLDGDWLALDEALELLRDTAPGALNHIMQTAMPKADQQLAGNILFFLSALRGGELKNWMGDGPIRILEKLRPDLAGRLKGDLGQMTKRINDPLSGDWRLHGVPFLHGPDIDRLQLLIRDQEPADEDEQEQRKGGTRFVVDLNLTRLGHLQIDGLVGKDDKRLDLVLRSDEALSSKMRDDIRRLYADALELTGIEGSVGFQAAPGGFVEIPKGPGASKAAPGGMVI